MSLAFGFALPHWQAISGGAFSPASLFAGGTVAGAWYDPSDLTTLFTTSAGTTQCAMPGLGSAVSVGRMLDKSQGLVLGSELVTNGDFSSGTTGWTAPASVSLTVVGGVAKAQTISGVDGPYFGQFVSVVAGTWYEVTFTSISDGTSDPARLYVGANVGAGVPITPGAFGTYNVKWLATTTGSVAFWPYGTVFGLNKYILCDNISVKALPGNHAIAFNDTTARPELRARVNLLTYSEDQSNGAWTDYAATQQSNVGTAPDGTNTADKIVEASGSTVQARYQAIPGGLSISYTVSAYAKADQRNAFHLSYSGAGSTAWFAATFELTGNGSVAKTGAGTAGTYISSSITPVGNGWYFCTVTGNPGQASTHYAYGGPSDTNNPTYGNFGVLTYSGNTANGVLVWGFDVRPANIGANVPAYQRIADANTYDTSGFPLYLLFDGIDDSMYTPAGIGIFGNAEFVYWLGINRQTTAANNAVFGWGSSSGAGQACGQYRVSSVESVQYAGGSPFNFANGPDFRSNVFSYIKTPGAINTTSSARLNGLPNNGTGNSSTVPNIANSSLKIGQWADFPSDFFNGQLYSLIIAGSAVSAGNISATEQWVAQRTGIVIP